MVASILAKKRTAGATHVVIDVPVGPTSKIRSRVAAEELCDVFRGVAGAVGLTLDLAVTEARGPIGRGIGPRLEALDVLAVLNGETDAPVDLREKSLYLAARLLELVGAADAGGGYRMAQEVLDSGAAAAAFARIVKAQGSRELPAEAPYRHVVCAHADGRIREIDCWQIARVAKQAGAPAQTAAGVRLLATVGDVAVRGEPLFEIHAQSEAHLDFARRYSDDHPGIFRLGF
jgi:thymidine phosphorylase